MKGSSCSRDHVDSFFPPSCEKLVAALKMKMASGKWSPKFQSFDGFVGAVVNLNNLHWVLVVCDAGGTAYLLDSLHGPWNAKTKAAAKYVCPLSSSSLSQSPRSACIGVSPIRQPSLARRFHSRTMVWPLLLYLLRVLHWPLFRLSVWCACRTSSRVHRSDRSNCTGNSLEFRGGCHPSP